MQIKLVMHLLTVKHSFSIIYVSYDYLSRAKFLGDSWISDQIHLLNWKGIDPNPHRFYDLVVLVWEPPEG